MKNGKFIIVEGGEGAGKTTQIKLLSEKLTKEGRTVLVTREPGGTPLAEKLRDIVKGHADDNEVMDPITELLLISAARRQHVMNVIKPALKDGHIVICDRFHLSTLAYQGYGRGIDLDVIREMNIQATGGLRPDMLLFLSINPEEGMARARGRAELDRIELAGDSFMKSVNQGLALEYSGHTGLKERFDARLPITELSREISDFVSGQLFSHDNSLGM